VASGLEGYRSGGVVEWDGRFVGLHDPPGDTDGFWDGIAAGRLMLKSCNSCEAVLHPRRIVCRSCLNTELSWIESSGRGTLYSFSTIFRPPHEEWASRVPYNLGLVQLTEGPHLFSEILCDPAELRIGLELELTIVEDSRGRLAKFRPSTRR
jgi:hypothetical protein